MQTTTFTALQEHALVEASRIFAIGFRLNSITGLDGVSCQAVLDAAHAILAAAFSKEETSLVYECVMNTAEYDAADLGRVIIEKRKQQNRDEQEDRFLEIADEYAMAHGHHEAVGASDEDSADFEEYVCAWLHDTTEADKTEENLRTYLEAY